VKRPKDCESIGDVRQAIDVLDQEIIGLIGRRALYVARAAHFKTGEQSVRAPERQRTMFEARRGWAEENGLDPDVIEDLYHTLVSYFVDRKLDEWRNS
jgi:isochorismate pyruvate lyase